MEGGKTVATYTNDSKGKTSSTSVNPDKKSATRKNQDFQIYVPTTNQQCFGTDLGNGDTFWFYMSNVGFEFNDVIISDGIKSDSFVAEYDGNRRVVIRGDTNGNSRTEYYDDLDRAMSETHMPETDEVKKEGVRLETYEFDGNNNVVLEYDSTGGSKQTNRSKGSEMREDRDPETGTATYDGFDRLVYDERDLRYITTRDSGTQKNSITNTGGTVRFE
ncbi:MAG: hypothetical protein ACI9JN_000062 [Bacteroidia bacterium]|jgi:hypothetical protein